MLRARSLVFLLWAFLPFSSIVKMKSETVNKLIELEFSDPQLEIIESTAQINLFHAGVGSGKTFIIGARNAIYALQYPHVRGFIGANTYQQLAKSTLVGVFKFWASIGIKRDIHYVVDRIPPSNFKTYGEKLKSYENTISFSNGKLIFLGSLDNYKAIDGQEFAHADLDETKDTAEEAVKEVILARLRQPGLWLDKRNCITTIESEGVIGFCPLNVYTSPAKTDWLADWFSLPKYFEEINACIFEKDNYFRKKIGDKLVVISSTYHNEHNLPKGYIETKLIEPNAHNKHRINMLVFGSPLAKAGNEYYNQFDRLKHVREVEYPANLPTHISFDFNVMPYMSSGLYKIWWKPEVNRWHVHKFDEVCLPPPEETTEHVCKRIIELYGHTLRPGVYIYGDYSGNKRNTNNKEKDYDVITKYFAPFMGNTSNRVIVNELVKYRKEFMNKIFYGSLPIDFTISPKCVKFIADCEFLQEDPNGGKLKKMVTVDGMSYQKYGHTSDETEYMFTSAFNELFNAA